MRECTFIHHYPDMTHADGFQEKLMELALIPPYSDT